jgi:hypothetical protein
MSQERLRLSGEIEQRVMALVSDSPSAEAERAALIVRYVVQALVGVHGAQGDEMIRRLARVLQGGRADRSDAAADDAVRIRACATLLEHWARYRAGTQDEDAPGVHEAVALSALRQGLAAQGDEALHTLVEPDEARRALSDADLLEALRKISDGGSMSGALTDMLIKARALGIAPTEARSDVQRRITSALKPR